MKRFFRVVWKINAILICLAGLLLLAVLGVSLFSLTQGTGGMDGGVLFAKPQTLHDKAAADLIVSKVETVAGTTLLRCTIESGDRERAKISSFSSNSNQSAICNYLFYDTTTNEQTTLFSSNSNVIIDTADFDFPASPYDQRITKWVSYVVANKDTDGDGLISGDDLKSLAVTRADGKDFQTYFTDLTRVLKTELIGENDFYAFYEKNRMVYVSHIDLANHKLINTTQIF